RQPNLYFHSAAFKLQLLAHYYWTTRDVKAVRELRPHWQEGVEKISARRTVNALLPPEDYCGDITIKVQPLTTNASCWKGLHDIAAVLRDMGGDYAAEAQRIATAADESRRAILNIAERVIRHETQPPFVPIDLSGN